MNTLIRKSSKKFKAWTYLILDWGRLFLVRSKIFNKTEKILFIGEYFPVRIQRLVKYLKPLLEMEMVLYIAEWGYEPKLIGEHFHRVEIYRNKFHLIRKLKSEGSIKLVHAFEPKAYYQFQALKTIEAPYIYDIQDITINYFGFNPPLNWQKKNLIFEKLVLENADGLISHSMELNEAIRNYRIQKRNPSLFFPLYCDSDNFRPVKTKANTGKTRFVYIGGINGITESISSNFLPLIKKMNAMDQDFTIFPSPDGEKHFYSMYKSQEVTYSNFHMERSVPFNKLDLTMFDIGVVPFEHEYSEKFYSKNQYASTMKFFVYLEMGIPVLVSEYWKYLAWLTKRYGLGIVSNYENLGNLPSQLKALDLVQIGRNIEQFREKFELKRNIPRLLDYYQFIIQKQ